MFLLTFDLWNAKAATICLLFPAVKFYTCFNKVISSQHLWCHRMAVKGKWVVACLELHSWHEVCCKIPFISWRHLEMEMNFDPFGFQFCGQRLWHYPTMFIFPLMMKLSGPKDNKAAPNCDAISTLLHFEMTFSHWYTVPFHTMWNTACSSQRIQH